MKCNQCGKLSSISDALFCPYCGERVSRRRRSKQDPPQLHPEQLASGRWRLRIRRDEIQVSQTFDTREEAVAWGSAVLSGLVDAPRKRSLTLTQAYDMYIQSRRGVVSPSTIRGYLSVQKHSFQGLMPLPIDSITQAQVQEAVSARAREGLSPKTIRNEYGLLTAVLRAYRPELSLDVRLPPKRKNAVAGPTRAEIGTIMQIIRGTAIEAPILMGLWLGLRISEILAVQGEDVQDGVLHVHRAKVRGEDGVVEKGVKSYAGDRFVSVPAYILRLLPKSGPVTTLSSNALYGRFVRLQQKHGIGPYSVHQLRHANAAIMASLGIDTKYAQARNGWSTPAMYRDQYAYIMDERAKEVDRMIDSCFEGMLPVGQK